MASTIRVEDGLHATLRQIAEEEHRPIGQVIEDAIGQCQKAKFWEGVQADFARLKADPAAWKAYQDEIALWDATSEDGLEHETPYYTPEEEAELDAGDARAFGG